MGKVRRSTSAQLGSLSMAVPDQALDGLYDAFEQGNAVQNELVDAWGANHSSRKSILDYAAESFCTESSALASEIEAAEDTAVETRYAVMRAELYTDDPEDEAEIERVWDLGWSIQEDLDLLEGDVRTQLVLPGSERVPLARGSGWLADRVRAAAAELQPDVEGASALRRTYGGDDQVADFNAYRARQIWEGQGEWAFRDDNASYLVSALLANPDVGLDVAIKVAEHAQVSTVDHVEAFVAGENLEDVDLSDVAVTEQFAFMTDVRDLISRAYFSSDAAKRGGLTPVQMKPMPNAQYARVYAGMAAAYNHYVAWTVANANGQALGHTTHSLADLDASCEDARNAYNETTPLLDEVLASMVGQAAHGIDPRDLDSDTITGGWKRDFPSLLSQMVVATQIQARVHSEGASQEMPTPENAVAHMRQALESVEAARLAFYADAAMLGLKGFEQIKGVGRLLRLGKAEFLVMNSAATYDRAISEVHQAGIGKGEKDAIKLTAQVVGLCARVVSEMAVNKAQWHHDQLVEIPSTRGGVPNPEFGRHARRVKLLRRVGRGLRGLSLVGDLATAVTAAHTLYHDSTNDEAAVELAGAVAGTGTGIAAIAEVAGVAGASVVGGLFTGIGFGVAFVGLLKSAFAALEAQARGLRASAYADIVHDIAGLANHAVRQASLAGAASDVLQRTTDPSLQAAALSQTTRHVDDAVEAFVAFHSASQDSMANDLDPLAAFGGFDANINPMKAGVRELFDEIMGEDPFKPLRDSRVEEQGQALVTHGAGRIDRMRKLLALMTTRAGTAWATNPEHE